MGAFYGSKIRDGEINTKTGKAWVLKDVPTFWRQKAKMWLEAEGYSAK